MNRMAALLVLLVLLLGDKTMAQPRDYWRKEHELGSIPLSVAGKLPNTAPRYQMNQATVTCLSSCCSSSFF